MHKNKNIVIVGGGFSGLACAIALEKQLSQNPDMKITVIDKNDYKLFSFGLYEVAAAEEEFTSMLQLKKSLGMPYKKILQGRKIEFMQGEVTSIDQEKKVVRVGINNIEYDYLVVATGSESFDFGIEGAKKYSMPLKTVADALRIRNAVEFAVQRHRLDMQKPYVKLVVAGGGYTGVELAGELSNLRKILSWKNKYPEFKIEIEIIEAANELIPGFSSRLSTDTLIRLKELGVEVKLLSKISKVDSSMIHLASGESVYFDVLVWTVGVKAHEVSFVSPVEKDGRGRIVTNEFLQAKAYNNIFVGGDSCLAVDRSGHVAPQSAQDAMYQGRYIARALLAILNNKTPEAYSCLKHGFIVSIGGKWAILSIGSWYMKGFFAYVIEQFSRFRYYVGLVGFFRALKYLYFEEEVFSRND